MARKSFGCYSQKYLTFAPMKTKNNSLTNSQLLRVVLLPQAKTLNTWN